jgi:DNA-binding FadR family transcriptional regulator
MSDLAEASGNVVFVLIMNSIRELYFEKAELFSAVVGDVEELGPHYEQAAAAVEEADADGAAAAIERLTRRQEKGLLG